MPFVDTSKILPAFLEDALRGCTIYGIRSKTDTLYIYIGSTRHDAQHRFKAHLKDITHNRHGNQHFARKAQIIGLDNLSVDTLEKVSEFERNKAEYKWINELRSQGHPLTNIRLTPYPPDKSGVITPVKMATWIFCALTAPEQCEIPENQALYSKLREISLRCTHLLLNKHRTELLHFLNTGEFSQ